MQNKTKYYWVIIVIFMLLNIGVFMLFSNKLGNLVVDYSTNPSL